MLATTVLSAIYTACMIDLIFHPGPLRPLEHILLIVCGAPLGWFCGGLLLCRFKP